jgi:hypothetical protein
MIVRTHDTPMNAFVGPRYRELRPLYEDAVAEAAAAG